MDYPSFVAARRERWDRFETELGTTGVRGPDPSHAELETLAVEYRIILHDHAVAQDRFRGSGAARRLERLVVDGTRLLRRSGRGPRWSVLRFYRRTFPVAMRSIHSELILCASLFLLTCALGFIIGIMQPEISVRLLGPERIADLKEGRLWTETLTTVVPATSSSFIATNNMSVALTGWAGGAAAGLGAFWVVLFNGFHFGSIFAATTHFGMSSELAEFVAAHGPLEISLILVCSAAGLGLGRSLVVAGDRPRWVVAREQSVRSLTILAACLPWFVVLAVIESVISPAASIPTLFKLALGAALVLLFFLLALDPKGEVS